MSEFKRVFYLTTVILTINFVVSLTPNKTTITFKKKSVSTKLRLSQDGFGQYEPKTHTSRKAGSTKQGLKANGNGQPVRQSEEDDDDTRKPEETRGITILTTRDPAPNVFINHQSQVPEALLDPNFGSQYDLINLVSDDNTKSGQGNGGGSSSSQSGNPEILMIEIWDYPGLFMLPGGSYYYPPPMGKVTTTSGTGLGSFGIKPQKKRKYFRRNPSKVAKENYYHHKAWGKGFTKHEEDDRGGHIYDAHHFNYITENDDNNGRDTGEQEEEKGGDRSRSKGSGQSGGYENDIAYKDVGLKAHGWKNTYHKQEYGADDKWHDLFKDKEWRNKWKNGRIKIRRKKKRRKKGGKRLKDRFNKQRGSRTHNEHSYNEDYVDQAKGTPVDVLISAEIFEAPESTWEEEAVPHPIFGESPTQAVVAHYKPNAYPLMLT